jgi:mannose-6-phosphate isomerase-like protein (cupin superfamily)
MAKILLEKKSLENKAYRKVLFTTEQLQLVVMNLPAGDDIPMETHKKTTQFIRVEGGSGMAIINNKKISIKDGDAIIIPAGYQHYIKNNGKVPLLLYTIYSPPEHASNLVQKTHK